MPATAVAGRRPIGELNRQPGVRWPAATGFGSRLFGGARPVPPIDYRSGRAGQLELHAGWPTALGRDRTRRHRGSPPPSLSSPTLSSPLAGLANVHEYEPRSWDWPSRRTRQSRGSPRQTTTSRYGATTAPPGGWKNPVLRDGKRPSVGSRRTGAARLPSSVGRTDAAAIDSGTFAPESIKRVLIKRWCVLQDDVSRHRVANRPATRGVTCVSSASGVSHLVWVRIKGLAKPSPSKRSSRLESNTVAARSHPAGNRTERKNPQRRRSPGCSSQAGRIGSGCTTDCGDHQGR